MSHTQQLLDRTAETPPPAGLPIRPQTNVVVVSCVDARIDPAHLFGLRPGEAVVIRSLGGRVTPGVEQEIAVLAAMFRRMAEQPVEVLLVHHTDCGMERLSDPMMVAGISQMTGVPARDLTPLAIHDHASSLGDDLSRLQASAVVPAGIRVTGVLFDAGTGRLTRRFSEVLS